jgi:hypothetical protein
MAKGNEMLIKTLNLKLAASSSVSGKISSILSEKLRKIKSL